jgi:hypothetical protein
VQHEAKLPDLAIGGEGLGLDANNDRRIRRRFELLFVLGVPIIDACRCALDADADVFGELPGVHEEVES